MAVRSEGGSLCIQQVMESRGLREGEWQVTSMFRKDLLPSPWNFGGAYLSLWGGLQSSLHLLHP
jgi:hypothetical protein